jgi:hypothetical protein
MRSSFYKYLLLFIVLAGLPVIAIPTLRNRLSIRIQILKAAWLQNEPPSITQVGSNENPFPPEYERPVPQISDKTRLSAIANPAPVAAKPAPGSESSPIKVVGILPSSAKKIATASTIAANSSENEAGSPEDSPNSLPEYKQGKNEKEAYELVLKSNKTLAAMVQGGNPALQWKTWGAAHRGEDSYWVRVIFLNKEKTEIEYIWQVKIASGEVLPLSYNARSIS